mmetsp:Transcript_1673/g.3453  ORF Transcript_1673/g.3453 Transcript_1673/m.3453 type:complete len:208 (+) Transcript_1673:1622-2245(+)
MHRAHKRRAQGAARRRAARKRRAAQLQENFGRGGAELGGGFAGADGARPEDVCQADRRRFAISEHALRARVPALGPLHQGDGRGSGGAEPLAGTHQPQPRRVRARDGRQRAGLGAAREAHRVRRPGLRWDHRSRGVRTGWNCLSCEPTSRGGWPVIRGGSARAVQAAGLAHPQPARLLLRHRCGPARSWVVDGAAHLELARLHAAYA